VTTLLRIFGLDTNDKIRAAFKGLDNNPAISYIEKTLGTRCEYSSYNEALLEVVPQDAALANH